MGTTLMWFRRDLRLADNPALAAALGSHGGVVPVFVWPARDDRRCGEASLRWLHRSLEALDASLRERGSWLVVRTGAADVALPRLVAECDADRVVATRDRTPVGAAEEDAVRRALATTGAALDLVDGSLLVDPVDLVSRAGTPFRVFTPFHRAWRVRLDTEATAIPAPSAIPRPAVMPPSSGPVTPPPGGPDITRWWQPGEAGARARLERFVAEALVDYDAHRDRPDLRGTSELSAHLAWGEISPRRVVSACVDTAGERAEPYLRQLAWREFASYVLHHAPFSADRALRPEFDGMPWAVDPDGVAAWRAGRTGYPLVDAGMRQLAQTGWMHNRVRLVAASLLTKHLLTDWRTGEAHFRDALVDLDVASNVFNWQWVAGSGADAAPYFRIFNPAVQGARFDPDGAYVRAWVPELEQLDARWIHRPSEAPARVLAEAGVRLGETYPKPVIGHTEARLRALAAFSAIRGRAGITARRA